MTRTIILIYSIILANTVVSNCAVIDKFYDKVRNLTFFGLVKDNLDTWWSLGNDFIYKNFEQTPSRTDPGKDQKHVNGIHVDEMDHNKQEVELSTKNIIVDHEERSSKHEKNHKNQEMALKKAESNIKQTETNEINEDEPLHNPKKKIQYNAAKVVNITKIDIEKEINIVEKVLHLVKATARALFGIFKKMLGERSFYNNDALRSVYEKSNHNFPKIGRYGVECMDNMKNITLPRLDHTTNTEKTVLELKENFSLHDKAGYIPANRDESMSENYTFA